MMAEEKVLKCRKWTTFLKNMIFFCNLALSLSFPMKNGEVKYADGA